jgi:hypothetical protein
MGQRHQKERANEINENDKEKLYKVKYKKLKKTM